MFICSMNHEIEWQTQSETISCPPEVKLRRKRVVTVDGERAGSTQTHTRAHNFLLITQFVSQSRLPVSVTARQPTDRLRPTNHIDEFFK